MDPDTCLTEILAEVESVEEFDSEDDRANLMAEKIRALDSWLSLGGHLPARWNQATR